MTADTQDTSKAKNKQQELVNHEHAFHVSNHGQGKGSGGILIPGPSSVKGSYSHPCVKCWCIFKACSPTGLSSIKYKESYYIK